MKQTKEQLARVAYSAPESQVVLLALEQCIAVSDKDNNDLVDEDFN